MKALRLAQGTRPHLQAGLLQRRWATSLPQIPGVIFANKEIPDDRLVSRIRKWAASSGVEKTGTFDLLQLAEGADGKALPRAVCCLLRTELLLADTEEPVKAMVTVFYRARDYLNNEFWEDQVRRLSDVLADEYLGGGRGVHLMVHQSAPKWAMGLEVSDHRLLAELEALTVLGSPFQGSGAPAEPELLADADSEGGRTGYHRLRAPPAVLEATQESSAGLRRGHYVLRDGAGVAFCGLEVLGVLPSRLVCGGAWAAEGREGDFGRLVEALRRKAGKHLCSLLADPRDKSWQQLGGRTAAPLGLWRSRKRLGVAITGVPVGLSPEEQARLAQAPFLVPWEFVPFHFGRLVLV